MGALSLFLDTAQAPFTAMRTGLEGYGPPEHLLWSNSPAVPLSVGGLSAFVFIVQTAKDMTHPKAANMGDSSGGQSPLARQLDIVGGGVIFVYRTVQFLCFFALLAISLVQTVFSAHRDSDPSGFLSIGYCAVYVYLAALGVLALCGTVRVGFRAYAHSSWVAACIWAVYMYRNIWPFTTETLQPADETEGSLMWIKLALLSLSGVIVPLAIPRKYDPLRPEEKLEPNPEQVTSLWSLLVYSFMFPIVWASYRMPHLPYDMLPPLSDFNHVRNLVAWSFEYLDPMISKSRRHVALKLIRLFSFDLLELTATSFVEVIAAFASPLVINNLLIYFETGTSTLRPWFWIALFFLGRAVMITAHNWFWYKTTRVNMQIEAIVTQLVFEHALRVRMKAETSDAPGATSSTSDQEEPTAIPPLDEDSTVASETDGTPTAATSRSDDSTAPIDPESSPSSQATHVQGKGEGISAEAASSVKKAESPSNDAGKSLVGRINNLVTSDLSSIEWVSWSLISVAVEAPLMIVLCMVFLYHILGWSAWVGLAVMVAALPVPGFITKSLRNTQQEKMRRTDSRVQLVTEMMNAIRMIKLFGWEPKILQQLNEKRADELDSIRRARFLGVSNNICNYLMPIIVMLATFFTYTVIMKESLTAAKVFSAMSVFDMLRSNISSVFYTIPSLIQANVALDRINDFLCNTELIEESHQSTTTQESEASDIIGIRNASFTWTAEESDPSRTAGSRKPKRSFVLHVEDELVFQHGKINLVVGATGSGKTSLLMALLGEMHYISHGPDSFVSLPRAGGVAYAAQESWVQNDTIKNNIVFGSPLDEERYNKVIDHCALVHDLSLFEAGDQTEVGEKGITLSGGQKARVTLARAVYSNAEILLLDDIFAALDVHTCRWIVDKCFKGDLLQGRTVILVTHNVALLSPIADFVVDIGPGGRILKQGSLASTLEHDEQLLKDFWQEQEEIEKVDQESPSQTATDDTGQQTAGKLVVEEDIEIGHVGWGALKLYLWNVARRPILFWCVYATLHLIRQTLGNFETWYLGFWASQYEAHNPRDVDVGRYLRTYVSLVAAGVVMASLCTVYFVLGGLRAGKIIHEKLLVSLLRTTMRWLDKTPTSRIITRCTQDIQTVDNQVSRMIEYLFQVTIYLLLKMFAVVTFSPIFLIPSIMISIAGAFLGDIMVKAQLCVKREMGRTKAPVLGHFGAAIGGIVSIRAYGRQAQFKEESMKRIDRYTRAAITHYNLSRWVTFRMDILAALYTTSLAVYLTYFSPLSASNAGFSLNMAAAFSSTVMELVRVVNELENSGNSLERIQQYLSIEHEPEPTPGGVPPAYWPASGNLRVQNLSARYSNTGPNVLRELSFEIKPGERVGIVGRTGSGKSSLTLALLRCIITEGTVFYDGVDVGKLNIDALRSRVTIIPQVPELLRGTLRQNLDPFGEHDDATLNGALRSAGLFRIHSEYGDRAHLTLDSEIAGGGSNLSVGQRQIVALARAIVRRSKLLIMDEATSAIDYETDEVIQRSLRTELGDDVTLLTVAHRLQTIMDSDKIIVLDSGSMVEFGTPSDLLKYEKGVFRALVDESSDREALYAMAVRMNSP